MIQQLPVENFTLLKLLVEHLRNVANHSQKNLMTASNLGICFAPTLVRGPEESSQPLTDIKYSNVVTNTLIEEYDTIFNDTTTNQQRQSYQNMSQPPRQGSTINLSNHADQFGLGLPSQNQYQNNTTMPVNHPNKPFKCLKGGSDLAQFALKSYDHHTSRPNTFISSTIPPIDIRPINDLKTYSFDQALMVPGEQRYQHLGGSMNNSLNYISYLGSQTSSHPNSLNYSSNSLNNVILGDQYNNQSQINSFPYYPLQATKLPYRSNKVITLYACVADTESELSFGPNEVITDGKYD